MNELHILPARLRRRSLSTEEIVLNIEDAIRAVDILAAAGWALLSWEGMVQPKNGKVIHSYELYKDLGIRREDNESWSMLVRRAALLCRNSLMDSHNSWDSAPDSADSELYFCLKAADRQGFHS